MPDLAHKKILYVITKSNWGGAQSYVYTLACAAKKAGADVAVALGGTGEPGARTGLLAQKLQEAGVRTLFVPCFMRDVRISREFSALRELIRLYKAERPDVVHLNSSKAGGIGALAGRIAHVPRIVFTSHGLAYDEKRLFLTRGLIGLFTWITIALSHATILISTDTYERARRLPFCKKKTWLIFNGVQPIEFLSREDARHALWPEQEAASAWTGVIAELTRNKSLDTLLHAVAMLRDRGVPAPLVIIGEGEERPLLERIIREKHLGDSVRLAGYVQGAARYLRAFDVFALVSTKEGLPYVLLEAGAASCAVVATRIAGTTDIIDATTGVLVPPLSPESTANALERLLRAPTSSTTFGEALRARIREKFSFAEMQKRTFACYTGTNS